MAATVGSLRIELSASIAQFQEDMGKAASAVKQTAAEFTKAGNDLKKVGSQMQGVGLALSKTLTLPLVAISAAVFKVGTDFEDAFAGVKKTVEGTPQQLQAISDAFRDMAKTIPTSATELAKIGETAGQLGVGKDSIVAFTKTIADISTATHLTAEEAATSFAKLAVVMKVPQDQFESLGSAVYSLGNFGASTEKEMLDMAQRIAGAGATVGLTADQVLGLANALSSVGVNAEAGGTAMSKVLNKMAQAAHDGGKALDEFAKVAGTNAAAFKQQFQTDAGGAVVAFLEGLARLKDSGGDLLGTLDALGIKQQRTRDSMLLIANAGHLAADSINVSSKAFSDHTAFLAAVSERYKTTSNSLKTLGNQIGDVGLTLFTSLKPAIEAGISVVQTLLPYIDSMAKAFATLPGGVQLSIIGVGVFAAALGPAIWLAGQLVSSIATLTLAFGKGGLGTRVLVEGLSFAENAFGSMNTAINANGAVLGALSIATKAEAASQAFYATVVAATSGALDVLSVRLGIATIATRVKAAASAIAAAAEEAFAVAIDLVGGSSLVMGVRMVAANIATAAAGLAAQAAAAGYTALGIAIDIIQLAPTIGAFIVLGFALKEASIGVSNLVKAWNEGHLWETLTAKDDNTFARRWLGLSQGVDAAGKSADAASDQFKTLKDRISGALATHDAGELTKVVTELSNEGQLTGAIMRRVAVEVANLRAQGATLTPELENIAKAFGAVTASSGGGNGFKDLTDSLKAARAEIAALSGKDLKALTEAVKSGAFSMKQIQEETGLSDVALKLFQDQIRENNKELKASNSIFDDYKKKVAELTTALTEGLKANVPVEFIERQFGTMIRSVEDDAGILGKTVPQIINDAFLKITIKEGTDNLQKQFVKFSADLDKQVKADMERVNATVIKTLGVIIDAGNSTADSEAQFAMEGLKNEIKSLEAVDGETAKSHELRKQLAAEEYQYQVDLIQRKGQAEKAALDSTAQDYGKALDAIDQATAAKMGLASQTYQQKIAEMKTSTKSWKDSLGELSGAFSAIASASGGAFSGLAKEIGSVIGALGNATKAVKDFNKASAAYDIAKKEGDTAGQYAATGNKIAAVANGIAAVAQATGSKNKVSAVIGGATSGAALGSIGGPIGAGVGAGVGALVGYIRAVHKGPAEKAAIDVGRDFGINISDGLAKELGELRNTIGQQAADIFDLDKIIAEGGGLRSDNLTAYTKKLRDTFVLVKTGALTAADGASVLDKNFANFANAFLANGPLISKDLVEIVRLTDDLGASSKAVGDFIKQQVTTNILPGLQAFTGASKAASDALADNQKKLKDLNQQLTQSTDPAAQADLRKQIEDVTGAMLKQQGVIAATSVTSQGAADALSASVAVAFAEMKAGTPIVDIVNQLEPVVDSLGKQFEAAGFSGGVAFQNIQKLVGVAADEIAGPAITAATGLGQALAGLSNIGQLDQGTFTGLTDQIDATFNSLVAQGQDGASVLALMQGPLQTIWQLSTEFGYSVDTATQGLLDQAIAAGEVGEKFKTPQQQMIDALTETNSILGSIAKALGATLPDAAKAGAAGLNDAFAKVNPKVTVDIKYNDPGFKPDVSTAATGGYVTPTGVQRFAVGGIVQRLKNSFQPQGTDTVPAMLTPGEVVLNQGQQGAIASALSDVSGSGGEAAKAIQASMAAAVQAVQSQLGTLPSEAASIATGITTALSGITVPDIVIKVRLDDSAVSGLGGGAQPATAATGGYVTPMGVQHFALGGLVQKFQSRGTDTVPAMLTPGELILNQAQQSSVAAGLTASPGRAFSAASLTGQENFSDLKVEDQRTTATVPAPAENYTVHLTVNALDPSSFRDMMTRPGGGVDMFIDSVSRGKRGRDELLRRGLAVSTK